jgi:hypothetical protein
MPIWVDADACPERASQANPIVGLRGNGPNLMRRRHSLPTNRPLHERLRFGSSTQCDGPLPFMITIRP